ncbi:MAG TPA: penicillin-binding protein 2 [Caulobacteraceae bacterium]|nr:penicillin-binding protein 2 [Caulobacteraceae bacterium]
MNPQIYFNEVNERQGVFHRRAFLMGAVAGVGMLTLAGRLAFLQLVDADKYKTLSLNNEFQSRLQPPPRGLILDRNGVVLASNRPDFRLYVSRDENTDIDALLDSLQKLVPLDLDHRNRVLQDLVDAPRRAPVTVMEDLTWEEFSRINVRTPELPGVTADMGDIRVYPFSAAFAHVIGYVAKVSKDDVTKDGPNSEPILLNPGFRIGKAGLEKTYDLPMRGTPGAKKVEVDVKGRVVREDPGGDVPSVAGKTLQLTLDADIQNRALEVFGADSGAAVMMDCRTGDVLCMLSAPSFDANRFVKGLTGPEYKSLADYDHKPLINKAVNANYPPGSTFKTMVALTALEMGIPASTQFTCNKAWFWGGRTWHCDQAHGTLDMKGGISHSCDIYFYQLALKIGGPDPIAKTATTMGLGQLYDIGVPSQRPGLIPTTEWVKKARPRDPVWHPGETPSVGIGQGAVSVNPLQLCVMCSRIANGGKALYPRLVRTIGGVEQPPPGAEPALPFAPEHIQFLHEAMLAVTNGGGTASGGAANLGLGPVLMAGKTGTAQSHSYGGGVGAHGAQGAWAERDHAWFIAFAPADDPRYAMAVLTEHGGFGAEASAPKAREIMRVALLKDPEVRARIVQPTPNVTTQPAAAAPPSAPAGIANPPAAGSPTAAANPAAARAAAAAPASPVPHVASPHAASPHHASAHAARAAPASPAAGAPAASPPAAAPAPASPPASDVPI